VLLRDWLASHEVTVVGMESTGVYWKPVYYLLEDEFECWLLNAQHLRNVPGRKTDVADAAWICQLVEHGLVRPSFVPAKPIRELRELTRYRKTLIHERTREVQRQPQAAGGRWDQAGLCGLGRARGLWPVDAGSAGRRDNRSGGAGRLGPRGTAQEACGVARGARGPRGTPPPAARG
jgi:hypothetical protein